MLDLYCRPGWNPLFTEPNDCHRGATFILIGGDDEGQYMPLTEDKIKRLKEAAKESEVPEYEEKKQDAPQVENQGILRWVRQSLCCGKKVDAEVDEEKWDSPDFSALNEEEEAKAGNRCTSLWKAITTCCGLVNYLLRSKRQVVIQI